MMLAFMVSGLLLAGTVTFTVQFAQLGERIERELEQEVSEIERLAARGSEAGSSPDEAYTDLDQLFDDYLLSTVPGQLETVVTLIDGEPSLIPDRERPVELDDPEAVALIQETYVPGQRVIREVELQGLLLRIDVTPVQVDGDPREGIFAVAIDIGTLRERIWRDVRDYTLISLVTILLAGAVGQLVAGRLLRPLTHLREATSAINHDDLTRRVHVHQADTDIAQLTVTFNAMLDRLEAGVADQRQFLDDAAHELRTPLTIIRGNLELVDADDREDVRQTHALVFDEIDRMQRLVNDLLLLAKAQRPDFVHLSDVDVESLTEDLLDRIHLLGERRWRRTGSPAGVLQADRQRLQQAVVQLAANAVKFSRPGTVITIDFSWAPPTLEVLGSIERPAPRYLVIGVQDTGAGIEPEQAARIFDRFGRADNARDVEGSGLGLAIVLAIGEAHQGTVTVESQPGAGSTFRLWIPSVRADAGATERAYAGAPRPKISTGAPPHTSGTVSAVPEGHSPSTRSSGAVRPGLSPR